MFLEYIIGTLLVGFAVWYLCKINGKSHKYAVNAGTWAGLLHPLFLVIVAIILFVGFVRLVYNGEEKK